MTEHHRTGVITRSGDTHVIDPTQDHAEAVNVDQLDRAGVAQEPAPGAKAKRSRKSRIKTAPATGIVMTAIAAEVGTAADAALTGDGSGAALDATTNDTPAE